MKLLHATCVAPVTRARSPSDRVRAFWITDESVDRMGDVLLADGLRMRGFAANPVVLLSHDTSRPIGRVVDLQPGTNPYSDKPGWRAAIEFAPAGVSRDADEALALVDSGILRAVSVGFRPIRSRRPSSRERAELGMPPGGTIFEEVELLEVSLVTVPANPAAIAASADAQRGLWRAARAWVEALG